MTQFDSVPPMELLIDAANSMPIGELFGPSAESKFSSLSLSDRAKWFRSQSLNDMASLSLRMNEDERDELKSWLKSRECAKELDSANALDRRG